LFARPIVLCEERKGAWIVSPYDKRVTFEVLHDAQSLAEVIVDLESIWEKARPGVILQPRCQSSEQAYASIASFTSPQQNDDPMPPLISSAMAAAGLRQVQTPLLMV